MHKAPSRMQTIALVVLSLPFGFFAGYIVYLIVPQVVRVVVPAVVRAVTGS